MTKIKETKMQFITDEQRNLVVSFEQDSYHNYLNICVDGKKVAWFVQGSKAFVIDRKLMEKMGISSEFRDEIDSQDQD